MSILAEPRRKQKIGPDPQNTAWQNDSSKFGQKMLERMGWKSGMGLGAKNHGKSEPVELVGNTAVKGLGCKRKYDDTWIDHQNDFQSVLAGLVVCNDDGGANNSSALTDDAALPSASSTHSLEARSKKSKARVHYHKFTRGKDLSRYSSNDLSCILGNKKSKRQEGGSVSDSEMTSSGGFGPLLTTNKEQTVADYFARKTSELRTKQVKVAE